MVLLWPKYMRITLGSFAGGPASGLLAAGALAEDGVARPVGSLEVAHVLDDAEHAKKAGAPHVHRSAGDLLGG